MDSKQEQIELGFGKGDPNQERIIRSDGSFNNIKIGRRWWERMHLYQLLQVLSWSRLLGLVIVWYVVLNLIFAGLYFLTGPAGFQGLVATTPVSRFWELFFFSAQTLTTVGYGRINPVSMTANVIATFELLVGLLNFALITGILYARFARPKPAIKFSEKAIIAPYKGGRAIMFRLVNLYDSSILKAHVVVSVGYNLRDAQGQLERRFVSLQLERSDIAFLASSWTVVHPLDDDSPFSGMSFDDMMATQPEIFVLFSAYDEQLHDMILARRSYFGDEFLNGVRFTRMQTVDSDGRHVVRLDLLNATEPVS